MANTKIIPIRSDLAHQFRHPQQDNRPHEPGSLLGFLAQATTILLWIAGFLALVQTLTLKP